MGYLITLCVGFILGSVLPLLDNKKLKKRYQEELDKLKKRYQEELNKISKKFEDLEKISNKEGE